MSAVPTRVVPLVTSLGATDGHHLVLVSIEDYGDWFDLRFARADLGATRPLPRRVPPADAWQLSDAAGTPYEVLDAVGRGDRRFSNGEARVRPGLPDDGTALTVVVRLRDDADPLTGTVDVPPR